MTMSLRSSRSRFAPYPNPHSRSNGLTASSNPPRNPQREPSPTCRMLCGHQPLKESRMRFVWILAVPAALVAGCAREAGSVTSAVPIAEKRKVMDGSKVAKSDDEWRKELTPEQYHILR